MSFPEPGKSRSLDRFLEERGKRLSLQLNVERDPFMLQTAHSIKPHYAALRAIINLLPKTHNSGKFLISFKTLLARQSHHPGL